MVQEVPKHKGGGKRKTRKIVNKMHEKILKFERGPGERNIRLMLRIIKQVK